VATARAHSLLLGLGDIEHALPLYVQALAACGPADRPWEYITARLGMAQALVLADRPDGVAEMLDETEALLREHSDDGQLAHLGLDRALLAWCVGDLASIRVAADAGQRHARAAGNSAWAQINLTAAGFGSLLTGDIPDAEIALIRAVRLALGDRNATQLGIALQGLAAVAARRGSSVTAARLLGAGTAITPPWPLMQRGLEPFWHDVRADLGTRFDEEIDRGRELAPNDALSLALETV
jgi:hypothetical protein